MKFILVFLCLFAHLQLHAEPEIIIHNETTEDLKFMYIYLNSNTNILIQETKIKAKKDYITTEGRFVINDNYLIEIRDTHIECGWAYTLWVRHANGWGIKLFVNRTEIATICAHKYSVIDFQPHAQLVFTTEQDGEEKLIFRNTGWWAQTGVFPIQNELSLNSFKKQFSDTELDQFLHGL